MDREWLPLLQPVAWRSPPLLAFTRSHDEVRARFGEPVAVDVDSNGLGPMDVWGLRFSCGLEVSLLVFRLHGYFEPLAPSEPGGIEVHANGRDEAHLRFHLGLAPEDLSRWLPDPLRHAPAVWRVRRQDDNGNVVDVDSFTSACEAHAIARTFEQRGHKQLYWVERTRRA